MERSRETQGGAGNRLLSIPDVSGSQLRRCRERDHLGAASKHPEARRGAAWGRRPLPFLPPPVLAGRAGGLLLRRGGRGGLGRAGQGHLGWLTWRGVVSVLQGLTAPRGRSSPPTPPASRVRPAWRWEPRSTLPPGTGCLFQRLCSLCPELLLPTARSFLPGLSPHHIPRPHTCSASRRHRHPDSRAGTAAAILETGAGGAGHRVTGRGLRGAGGTQGGSAARAWAGPRVAGRGLVLQAPPPGRPGAEPERRAAGRSSERAR